MVCFVLLLFGNDQSPMSFIFIFQMYIYVQTQFDNWYIEYLVWKCNQLTDPNN